MSVSRCAGPPHFGQVDVAPGRMAVERIAGPVEVDVVGELHRQVLAPDRHHAAGRAVEHRDRAAPVALARDAPVAQAVIHLPLGDRAVAARLGLQAVAATSSQATRFGMPVEEGGVDHRAVAVIGLVARWRRSRRRRPAAARPGSPAARICGRSRGRAGRGRAAEDGAGAVIHQHEIGDDRPAACAPDRARAAPSGRCRSRASPPSRSPPPRCRCGGSPR